MGHQWGSASCTDPRKCNTCGATDGEPINHVAGDAVRENEVAGTCTAEGSYDSVTYCELCKKEIGRETVKTEMADHIPSGVVNENEVPASCTENGSYDNAVSATCTTDGLTEGSHCSLCNAIIVVQQVVTAPGHSYAYSTNGTLVYGVADGSCSRLTLTETCSSCSETKEITDYTVNLADSTISVGEDKVPVTMALNYVGGEHTLTSGKFESISLDGATLNINGNVTVTGTVTATNGKLNFLGGSSIVDGSITTTDSFLLVTNGAVLTVNSNVNIKGTAVSNSAAEFGYDHRFAVIDGTVNVKCSFKGGAVEANSILIGSVKNNTKGILNLTNTASKGNGLDNISAFRWMFANGEVNCVGNEDKTGTAVCMGKSGKGYIDFCRGMKFDMKNFHYGIGEWYGSSSRYIGVEYGITVECEDVLVPLHAQKNTYLYTHSYVEMEYTHDGKTGLALVNIECASQTFTGDFNSFSEFTFPTADNYYKVTNFVAWVEAE